MTMYFFYHLFQRCYTIVLNSYKAVPHIISTYWPSPIISDKKWVQARSSSEGCLANTIYKTLLCLWEIINNATHICSSEHASTISHDPKVLTTSFPVHVSVSVSRRLVESAFVSCLLFAEELLIVHLASTSVSWKERISCLKFYFRNIISEVWVCLMYG